jgi:5-methylcytosine-specific restriction enzyme A
MAVTHGHGNPKWTRDETILALDLYFDYNGRVPSSSDPRIIALSDLLRTFPYHSSAARQESFRNPDGVAFKLQNLRQIATGKGLGNVSKMDKTIWYEFGDKPGRTKSLADLIRSGIKTYESYQEEAEEEEFAEGRVVTEAHKRRERNPKLRKKLIEQRKCSGPLDCELCGCKAQASEFGESIFEAHHMQPIAAGIERITRLKDMALLCANCHRMIHRAIAKKKCWLDLKEAKKLIIHPNS